MLDTNIASDIIRHPAGPASQRARAVEGAVCVSIIVAAELRYGSAKKKSPGLQRRVDGFLATIPIVPLEVPIDHLYGDIRAELEAAGQPIGRNDLLIAAHALALTATLVTANLGELTRVRGLTVENWLG